MKLEKDVEGVGRYTAGAICSMAYGVKTPIVSRVWVFPLSNLELDLTSRQCGKGRWECAQAVEQAVGATCTTHKSCFDQSLVE